jgi:hypothetical protein
MAGSAEGSALVATSRRVGEDDMRFLRKRALGATAASVVLLVVSPARAFKPSIHEDIVAAELASMSKTVNGRTLRFTAKAIQQIREADSDTDSGAVTNSGPFADPLNHFDNELFAGASGRLVAIKEEIIGLITDPKSCSGDQARKRLGRALHGVQDFYSHSNWVELGFTDEDERLGRSTFGATAGRTCPTDPGVLDPALSGLRDLTSGYYFGRCGKDDSRLPAGKCYHGVSSIFCDDHAGINKDDPGRPNHGAARSTARKATNDYVQQILGDPRVTNNERAIKLLMGLGGSLGIVIDDTGSMGEEIGQVKAQVNQIVASVRGTDKEPTDYVLVRYGDPDVGPAVAKTNADEFLAAVNALSPGGGGDCPELLMQAELQAIAASCENSTIFTFTDASAKDASLAGNVNAARAAKKIQITSVLSGSCSPIDPSIVDITESSGGQLFFINQFEFGRVFDLVRPQLTGDFVTIQRSRGTVSPGTPREFRVPVDSTLTTAVFSVSVDVKGAITLLDPAGAVVDGSTPGVTVTTLSTGWIVTVVAPAPGLWTLSFTGSGTYRMAAQGNGGLDFFDFDFVRLENPAHPGFFPVPGEPVAGSEHVARATLIGPNASTSFRLLDEEGATLQPIDLGSDPDASADEFVGGVTLPDQAFRVAATGLDGAGHAFERLFPGRFRLQTIEVLVNAAGLPEALPPGATTTLRFTVRNVGPPGSFRVIAADNLGFLTRVAPTLLTLGTDEAATVEVDVTVPVGAPAGTLVAVNVTATSLADPGVSNGAALELPVAPANRPPDCSAAAGALVELWPPNHQMVDLDVPALAGVTDPDGDPVTLIVDGVTQDEPVDAPGGGDGHTSPDAVGLGEGRVQVRAERSGGGNGRVYALAFTAGDGKGGSCRGAVAAHVRHDQGGSPAVDDGQSFDSTRP